MHTVLDKFVTFDEGICINVRYLQRISKLIGNGIRITYTDGEKVEFHYKFEKDRDRLWNDFIKQLKEVTNG